MNAVIKINTADLTEQVIHDLKAKYGSAELEIRVRSEHEKEALSTFSDNQLGISNRVLARRRTRRENSCSLAFSWAKVWAVS